MSERSQIDELTPSEAFNALGSDPSAQLVDVRTRAEWSFVGVPDLSGLGRQVWTVEWVRFPDMQPNPDFLATLLELSGGRLPDRLCFICRSGARSMAAARLVAAAADDMGHGVHCTNVAEGFEGDLNPDRHRGTVNGWKAHGLPWQQN
ncbi:MAG: rhodanese-like domain-containing protein [Pseudomonadota bacterium]